MTGLRSFEWLDTLEPAEWETLRARATYHAFAMGATVFSPTPDPHSVYVLETGRIRILRISSNGDEVTLGYVTEGEVFGELPGFGEHPRESFAVARTQSNVWKIPLDLFRHWLRTKPEIAIEIIRQMSDRMKRVESRVENLVFGDVRARLATALLELGKDFGRPNGGACIIDIGVSQGELATLIGSTRQSVNVAMSALKDEGLIRSTGQQTELLEIEPLREIARSSR